MSEDAGHAGKRWLRLAADYSLDPSIIDAGWDAELLYLRGLAYCRLSGTDGRISLGAVKRIAVGYEGEPSALVYRLIDQGLWLPWNDGTGYSVRNYDAWQMTEFAYRRKAEQNAERQRRYRQRKQGNNNGDEQG